MEHAERSSLTDTTTVTAEVDTDAAGEHVIMRDDAAVDFGFAAALIPGVASSSGDAAPPPGGKSKSAGGFRVCCACLGGALRF